MGLLGCHAVLLEVRGEESHQIEHYKQQWQRFFDAVQAVDAGAIAKSCGSNTQHIKEAIYNARLEALKNTP